MKILFATGNETVTNCDTFKFKAKDDLEKKLGKKVITSNNKLNYKYKDDYKMIDNK